MLQKRTLLISTMIIALSACASTPKPDPVVEAVAETAPVLEPPKATAPEPIIQAPVVDTGPVVTIDPNAPTPGTAADFAYQSGGEPRVFFGYDRYSLSSDARTLLKQQADWLNTYDTVSAIIEGNADERGTREYNLALAARRAESIKSYLVAQGIRPSRLTTVSYGKERPIDGRSSEAGWSRNRNGHTNVTRGAVG